MEMKVRVTEGVLEVISHREQFKLLWNSARVTSTRECDSSDNYLQTHPKLLHSGTVSLEKEVLIGSEL